MPAGNHRDRVRWTSPSASARRSRSTRSASRTAPFNLTISVGVASTSGDATLTAAGLMRMADENLYQAKRAGRNRVVSSSVASVPYLPSQYRRHQPTNILQHLAQARPPGELLRLQLHRALQVPQELPLPIPPRSPACK